MGKAFAATLKKDGITLIGDLQKLDQAHLVKKYGEIGLRLYTLSRGQDRRHIQTSRETKSVSSETTFNEDIRDVQILEDYLWELCEKVSIRMKAKDLSGRVVTLKLKSADFKSITRRVTLDQPSNLTRIAFNAAKQLLHVSADGRAYRLIGVGYSDLSTDQIQPQSTLFTSDEENYADQERAIDSIREKFGKGSIVSARSLRPKSQR